MQAKRALLIAINAYPHVTPLNGCVNDVHLMRSVLVDTFGFPAEHITLLTDWQATRAGILSAFEALVSATGRDDIVVIHYAGHGSQMADREGDEASGFDSTIVPFDAARPPGDVADITDDEINLVLEDLARKTAFITLIFDACHSGTITRDVFGELARSVEPDGRPASELPPSPIPADRRKGSRSVGPSGWMPLADKYVLIAGCRDEERSYEYRPPEGGGAVVHGALTYFLCQQLRQATGTTSYRDGFERAAALVNAENSVQHPQMEGRTDRQVFGVADLTPARFVRVLEREDDVVLLGAGAAHGMTVGSTWRVFPQGTKDPKDGEPLGEVTITEVQAVSAMACITREEPSGGMVPDARAFEATHAFGDQSLAVRFADTDDAGGKAAALRARLGRSKLVTIVAGDASAAACIHRLAARTEVSPFTPAPQAGALAEPRWAVVSATGDLLMPLKTLDDVDAVVENLETIAKYRQALAIENPDPLSRLRDQFTVELQRLGSDRKTWSAATPPPDSGQVVFEEGDIVRFVIKSQHDADVFVSLFDFGLSGTISPIYPPRGGQEKLRALGDVPSAPHKLGFPPVYPFVDSPDHAREAEGIETVKLFVTEQPADFSVLEQAGVRSDAPRSPLAILLSNAFQGKATRDTTPVSLGDEDWTTVSRAFVLRRRTSAPLPANGGPVTVGNATLTATGLSATVGTSFGKKGREQSARLVTDALHRALDLSGVETRQTVEIANAQEIGPASRSIGDQPALELRLPEPEEGYGQMVLAADELGVVSWCFEARDPGRLATRGLKSPPPGRTYLVPRGVPVDTAAGSRGLVGFLGSKFLKELVFPLVDPVLGEVGASFANRLEQKRWPYRVRTFASDDYALEAAAPIDRDGWSRLASGRALLMVHGTFSRAHLAFGQLPKDYVEELHRLYGGRVFAFDHFTLSHDPKENVRWLVSQIPDNADLTLDIVSHSRGGLVSRLLGEKQGELSLGGRRVRIGKVVFVGAPSAGTALADPEHVGKVLDVFTNLMNFLPDNGVTDVMTMIVEAAKLMAVGVLSGLDGLKAMRPNGDFAKWLNAGARSGGTRYFAVASDVSPSDPGLRHLVLTQGLDRVLKGANDFVVPTESVFGVNGSGFFPIEERLVLEGEGAVAHTKYFADARVRRRILDWLTA